MSSILPAPTTAAPESEQRGDLLPRRLGVWSAVVQRRDLRFVPARRGVDALPAARGPPWNRLVSSNDFASGGPGAFRSFMFAKEGDTIWLRNYSLLCSRSSSRSRG
jgi:hypothetical protein